MPPGPTSTPRATGMPPAAPRHPQGVKGPPGPQEILTPPCSQTVEKLINPATLSQRSKQRGEGGSRDVHMDFSYALHT